MKFRAIKYALKDGTEIIVARLNKGKNPIFITLAHYEIEEYWGGKTMRGWYDSRTCDNLYNLTHYIEM